MQNELASKGADLEKSSQSDVPLDVAKELDRKDDDAVATFLAEVAKEDPSLLAPWDQKEERRLLKWKIDPIVMTLSQFALMMGAVDKVCIGTAAVIGMRTDLNLTGNQYSWISSIIYFGAIIAVFPSLFLMQRISTGKWLSFNCSVWGIILMASAAAKDFGAFSPLASFSDSSKLASSLASDWSLVLIGRRPNRTWRTAVIFSTLSSVVNGLLSYAAAHYHGSLGQWQVLFLSVGGLTFAWSILCWIALAGTPLEAWWMTNREKVIAVRRTAQNRTGVANKTFKKSQIYEALLDPKSWLIFCINIVLNVPNNGVLTFNSIIVRELGFSTNETMLMALPTGVISWIASLVFTFMAAKTQKRCLSAIVAAILPFIGTIILYVVPRSNIGGSLAGLYILFCYWGPYIVVQTMMYANSAGHTKKTATYCISYIGYCVVRNLIGPQAFVASDAPRYTKGVAAMLVCYAIAIVLIAVYWAYLIYLNKKKDQQLAEYEARLAAGENLLESWHDQTDFENPRFRYCY